MSINTTEKSGLVQQIRSGVVLARKAMIAALSARPGAPVRLGDEANQIELFADGAPPPRGNPAWSRRVAPAWSPALTQVRENQDDDC
jgi:hypothetical protein